MSRGIEPPDAYLNDIVRAASDSVEFRVALRHDEHMIDHLAEEQIRKVIAQCRIERQQPKSTVECRAVLREWLRAKKEYDTEVTFSREGAGGKRKPPAFDSGVVPSQHMPQEPQWTVEDGEGSSQTKTDSGDSVWDSLDDLYDAWSES